MGSILAALSVVLSAALLWTGIKRLHFARLTSAVLSTVEILGLVFTVVTLGWIGAVLLLGANVAGAIGWGIVSAVKVDRVLTYAAIQSGSSIEATKELYKSLRDRSDLRAFGPLRWAELTSLLAQRARSLDEIADMAPPIVMLWLVHEPDLAWLVEQFDRALRLYGHTAAESMQVADTMSATAQHSAASFTEIVDALVDVAAGLDDQALTSETPAQND